MMCKIADEVSFKYILNEFEDLFDELMKFRQLVE